MIPYSLYFTPLKSPECDFINWNNGEWSTVSHGITVNTLETEGLGWREKGWNDCLNCAVRSGARQSALLAVAAQGMVEWKRFRIGANVLIRGT